MLSILKKAMKRKEESAKTTFKDTLLQDTPLKNTSLQNVTPDDHSGIALAIAAVRESDRNNLEQRIHLFTLVKDSVQKPSEQKADTSLPKLPKLADVLDDADDADSLQDDTDDTLVNVRYSFHDEELAKNFYKSASIDYLKLFYGDTGKVPPQFAQDNDYFTESVARDTDSETIQTHEAEKSFMSVQYATMLGAHTAVHFKDRNKLDMWIKFNKDLFGMFEHSVALTREIDYARRG
ncbi:MAG TPA: hypothetical protein VJI15_04765 [Candidatus Nanoarchaeia archaeon]|nr:hypothetical protein [Candidatus Nanoarchaeia archaeon]